MSAPWQQHICCRYAIREIRLTRIAQALETRTSREPRPRWTDTSRQGRTGDWSAPLGWVDRYRGDHPDGVVVEPEVCRAWRLRSEVEVLDWGPDRGNPTLMRQGRGSGFTGRSLVRPGLDGAAGGSVRAGLKEAVGVLWSRTRVKRRKAFRGRVSWPLAAMPCSCRSHGRSGDAIAAKSLRLIPGDLSGSGRLVGRPENT